MMRAYTQRESGTDAALLTLESVPLPTLRETDVLLLVLGVSTNPVDNKVRRRQKAGQIVGFDGAGKIYAMGPLVKGWKEGDDVWFAGDFTRNGCFAEYVAIDYRIIARKPANLSYSLAASIPLTALTAYEGLTEVLGWQNGKGKTLLVVGAAGGLGSMVCQVAKKVLQYDMVIGTASRPATTQFARDMGCDHVINHADDMPPQLAELGFTGVDVIFNCAEADQNFDLMAALLNPLGHLILVTGLTQDVNLTQFMMKRCSIHWELMFSRPVLQDRPEVQGEILTRFAKWVELGVINHRVLPSNTFKLAELPSLLQVQLSGSVIGKLVVDTGKWRLRSGSSAALPGSPDAGK